MPEEYRIPVVLETKGFAEATQQSKSLGANFKSLSDSSKNLSATFKNVSQIALGGLGIRELARTVATFNKSMYDLTRQGKLAGIGMVDLQKGVTNLSNQTKLSRQEAANFYKQVNQMTVGAKMSAEQIKNLGVTISNEFGPSVEDVTDALQKLMQVQNKNISLFKSMQSGMDPAAATTYAITMETLYGVSSDVSDAFVRFNDSVRNQGKNLTEGEKKLRGMADSVKGLDKATQNVKLDMGLKAEEQLKMTYDVLTQMTKTLEGLPSAITKAGVAFGAFAGVPALFGQIVSLGKGMTGIGGIGGGGGGRGGMGGGLLGGLASMFRGGGGGGKSMQGDMCGTCANQIAQNVSNEMGKSNKQLNETLKAQRPKVGPRAGVRPRARFAPKGPGLMSRAGRSLGRGVRGVGGFLKGGGMLASGAKLLGGGAVAALGGIVGNAVGDAIEKSGHKTLGAGVRAGTNIGSMALGGAAMGSALLPGIGTAIGGLAGAAYGVVSSFEDIKTVVGDWADGLIISGKEIEQQQDRLAKQYGIMNAQIPDWWDNTKNFFLSIAGLGESAEEMFDRMNFGEQSKKMFDKAYEDLNDSQKQQVKQTQAELAKLSSIGGETGDPRSQLKAAAMTEMMKGVLAETGRSSDTDSAIKAIAEYQSGKLPNDVAEGLKMALADERKVKAVKSAAEEKYGKATGATKEDIAALGKSDFSEESRKIQLQQMRELIANTRQQNELLRRQTESLGKQFEWYTQIIGKQSLAGQIGEKAVEAAREELDFQKKRAAVIGSNAKEQLAVEVQRFNQITAAGEAGKKMIKDGEQEFTISEALERSLAKQTALRTSIADETSAVIDREQHLIDMELQRTKTNEGLLSLNQEQLSVLDSQQDLAKSLYAGAGASIAIMQQQFAIREQNVELLDEQRKKAAEVYAREKAAGNDSVKLKNRVIELDRQILQQRKAQADMTKEIAEGYLDAMMATSNAEGSFQKFILGREDGIAKLQRDVGAAQGQRAGMLSGEGGAGATEPMMRLQKGVGITYDQQALERTRDQFWNARQGNLQLQTMYGQRPFMGQQSAYDAMFPGTQEMGFAAMGAANQDIGMAAGGAPARLNQSEGVKALEQQKKEVLQKLAPMQEQLSQGIETPQLKESFERYQDQLVKIQGEQAAVQNVDDMATAVEKGTIAALEKTGMSNLYDAVSKQGKIPESPGEKTPGVPGVKEPESDKGLSKSWIKRVKEPESGKGLSKSWIEKAKPKAKEKAKEEAEPATAPKETDYQKYARERREAVEKEKREMADEAKAKTDKTKLARDIMAAEPEEAMTPAKNAQKMQFEYIREQEKKEGIQGEVIRHPKMGHVMGYRMDLGDISQEQGMRAPEQAGFGPGSMDAIANGMNKTAEELEYEREASQGTKANTDDIRDSSNRTAAAAERMANAMEADKGKPTMNLGGGGAGGGGFGFDYFEKMMGAHTGMMEGMFGGAPKLAKGGVVYGKTGGDKVPALLEHGEVVLPKSALANDPRIRKFQQGGFVLSIPSDMTSDIPPQVKTGNTFEDDLHKARIMQWRMRSEDQQRWAKDWAQTDMAYADKQMGLSRNIKESQKNKDDFVKSLALDLGVSQEEAKNIIEHHVAFESEKKEWTGLNSKKQRTPSEEKRMEELSKSLTSSTTGGISYGGDTESASSRESRLRQTLEIDFRKKHKGSTPPEEDIKRKMRDLGDRYNKLMSADAKASSERAKTEEEIRQKYQSRLEEWIKNNPKPGASPKPLDKKPIPEPKEKVTLAGVEMSVETGRRKSKDEEDEEEESVSSTERSSVEGESEAAETVAEVVDKQKEELERTEAQQKAAQIDAARKAEEASRAAKEKPSFDAKAAERDEVEHQRQMKLMEKREAEAAAVAEASRGADVPLAEANKETDHEKFLREVRERVAKEKEAAGGEQAWMDREKAKVEEARKARRMGMAAGQAGGRGVPGMAGASQREAELRRIAKQKYGLSGGGDLGRLVRYMKRIDAAKGRSNPNYKSSLPPDAQAQVAEQQRPGALMMAEGQAIQRARDAARAAGGEMNFVGAEKGRFSFQITRPKTEAEKDKELQALARATAAAGLGKVKLGDVAAGSKEDKALKAAEEERNQTKMSIARGLLMSGVTDEKRFKEIGKEIGQPDLSRADVEKWTYEQAYKGMDEKAVSSMKKQYETQMDSMRRTMSTMKPDDPEYKRLQEDMESSRLEVEDLKKYQQIKGMTDQPKAADQQEKKPTTEADKEKSRPKPSDTTSELLNLLDNKDKREMEHFGGLIRKFAEGDVVPGTGNSDTVPAMLTAGEFVVRAGPAKKNLSILRAINSGQHPEQFLNAGGMVLHNVFSPVVPSPDIGRYGGGGSVTSFNNTFNLGGGGFNKMIGEITDYLSNQWQYPYGGSGRRAVI